MKVCIFVQIFRLKMEDTTEDFIEIKINNFIKESLDYSDQQIAELQLQQKMSIVEMRDKAKWDEFREGLRKLGYII